MIHEKVTKYVYFFRKLIYNYFNIKLDVLDVKVENSLAVRQRLIGRES